MKSKMLGNVFALMMSMAVLSACEKMVVVENPETQGRGNVVLRVTQFEQTPFEARSRSEVGDFCTRLCFHVYGEDGIRVSYVNQKQEDDGFGTASFSLDAGRYYLVVVGHSGSSNPSFSANERVSISGKQMGDTFWCCEELVVGDEELEKSLVLNRIVSKLRFIPTDQKPENLNQLIFTYTGSRGTFDGQTGFGSTTTKQTVDLDVSADDSEYEFYLIPRDLRDSIDVTVASYYKEPEGRVHDLTKKTIERIPLRRNSVTICRGNLFDNKSSSHSVFITVSVNGDWNDDINLNF
ncbi:MAG: hypothetical protein IJ868_01620 [Prevotella sp.]|nr:hypothetical protein [Prevotella sp.]